MITKERLEILVREGATIYIPNNRKVDCICLDGKHKPKLFKDSKGYYGLSIYYFYKDTIDIYPIEYLFETKEQAEFALRYKRIPKTEYLDLPFFEEIEEYCIFEFSNTRFEVDILENRILVMTKEYLDLYNYIFDKPATKENYLEACELCKKLWLGEQI